MCARILHILIPSLICAIQSAAINPQATLYSYADCQGSAKPYVAPKRPFEHPDSLTPLFIAHVGRHGARFASSPAHTSTILRALDRAGEIGTITPLGKRLQSVIKRIVSKTDGRWGELDSLGALEQRGIAARMFLSYPSLFVNGNVVASSSYVPRCVMSMFEFLHEISHLNPKTELSAASGPHFSPLMRFFATDSIYKPTVDSPEYRDALSRFTRSTLPMAPLRRVLGDNFPFGPDSVAIAMAHYEAIAGMEAIGLTSAMPDFFTPREANALWQIFNLRQYLDRTATTLSSIPAQIASPLLENIISSIDRAARGTSPATVMLHFGHAETLMPLLSLMRLPGCYYLTHNFDSVARNWRDFDIVPMAANIQFILFSAPSGRLYLRIDLNEQPTPLTSGATVIYTPWTQARNLLISRLPL